MVGVLSVFSNTKNYEENRFNTNCNFSVDIENDKKIESKNYLKSFGITEKDKFVCIHVTR